MKAVEGLKSGNHYIMGLQAHNYVLTTDFVAFNYSSFSPAIQMFGVEAKYRLFNAGRAVALPDVCREF